MEQPAAVTMPSADLIVAAGVSVACAARRANRRYRAVCENRETGANGFVSSSSIGRLSAGMSSRRRTANPTTPPLRH